MFDICVRNDVKLGTDWQAERQSEDVKIPRSKMPINLIPLLLLVQKACPETLLMPVSLFIGRIRQTPFHIPRCDIRVPCHFQNTNIGKSDSESFSLADDEKQLGLDIQRFLLSKFDAQNGALQ
ncbi:hypothetical protein HYFRA_00009487 [Hymenoscyphus fraxineus]|uniref:Uncharacterized protein n=1 Tax=Hymenoscyphus fraxineus TaxID=746836 RepID=A0A9N9KZD6_9HELO|nr:hypothetical protein HYFRA_00009487 [Hymenoscyphus fraxineus]